MNWGGGKGLMVFQMYYIYCALYYYYITAGHQALDLRGWGPCFRGISMFRQPANPGYQWQEAESTQSIYRKRTSI